jgi:hypothetical protein
MRLMDLSNATPCVKIKQSDINFMCQDLCIEEEAVLRFFDYLSAREIVDIRIQK